MEQTGSPRETQVRAVGARKEWDDLVEEFGGTPFQLWGWGEVKAHSGSWQALHLAVEDHSGKAIGGALVLLRRLPFPFRRLAYVPRGPFGEVEKLSAIAEAVTTYVRTHTPAVSITFEPNLEDTQSFAPAGGLPAPTDILLPSTLVIDLSKSEEELMADMAKKTRQYIRRSTRVGVTVSTVSNEEELETCLDIYDETAKRAEFALHSREYYRTVYREFGPDAPIYLAYLDGEPVAFLWVLASGSTAVDLYGGALPAGFESKANFGIKWQAFVDHKAKGVRYYDLNGLLDEGISHFKRGFASHVTQMHHGVEIPLSRLYPVWAKLLPKARSILGALKLRLRRVRARLGK